MEGPFHFKHLKFDQKSDLSIMLICTPTYHALQEIKFKEGDQLPLCTRAEKLNTAS